MHHYEILFEINFLGGLSGYELRKENPDISIFDAQNLMPTRDTHVSPVRLE